MQSLCYRFIFFSINILMLEINLEGMNNYYNSFREKGFMKKAFKIIIMAIVVVSIYNFFLYFKEQVDEKKRIEIRKRELEALRKKEEQERIRLLEEVKSQYESNTHVSPTPIQETRIVKPAPSPRSTVNHRYEVNTICTKCRCKLLTYNEQGHAIYIEVAGPDHSTVSDILPELIKAGVVNFTEHRDKFGAKIVNGKRVYTAAYTLRW